MEPTEIKIDEDKLAAALQGEADGYLREAAEAIDAHSGQWAVELIGKARDCLDQLNRARRHLQDIQLDKGSRR